MKEDEKTKELSEKVFGVSHDEAALRKEWQKEARDMTLEKLPEFLRKLAEFKHDYGSIVVALGAAASAAAWALEHSPSGGITSAPESCSKKQRTRIPALSLTGRA